MNASLFSRRLYVCCASASLLIAGCAKDPKQPQIAKVSGRVTMGGQPISGLTIVYNADGGRPSYGQTDQDGRYKMHYTHREQGVKVGPAGISFDPFSFEGTPPTPMNGYKGSAVAAIPRIPQKYFQVFKQVEVTPGANEIDIDIVP